MSSPVRASGPIEPRGEVTVAASMVLGRRVDAKGVCSGVGTDEWFPPEPDARWVKGRENYEATARRLCGPCPVRAECLELAMRAEARQFVIPHGIFGGLAPWERAKLLRRRRRRAYARTLREGVPA